jgi:hypothetical protein
MALTNVTGLLSRYFAVGFFLPSYFALLLLWICASRGFVPDDFEHYKGATQIAVLGGIALLVALALSGLNYSITRFFEGYPLEKIQKVPVLRFFHRRLLAGQQRRFDRLVAVRDDEQKDSRERTGAAWKLNRHYPATRERLLPTTFGNAIRAFEAHAHRRYGLDGIAAFPRIEMMLTPAEREPLIDAKIDLNVFMNAAIGAALVGAALVIDAVINTPLEFAQYWVYAVPFVVARVLYGPMVGAAIRWGTEVRAGVDIRRLELYEKLGFRRPKSFLDERDIAQSVNYLLLYGVHPSDDLWGAEEEES